MRKPKEVKVVQNPEKPLPTEVLAEDIHTIAHGMRVLTSGRMNRRALILLIQDACTGRISLQDIQMVLGAVENLDKHCLRK